MTPSTQMPPRWAEVCLERLLAARDREAIAGDLREEYAALTLPNLGRLRADLWYLRQVLCFLPRFFSERGRTGEILLCVSVVTFACACWLVAMEMALRHSGYVMRVGTAIGIALISLAVIVVRMLHLGVPSERWLWAGAVALIGTGSQAFLRNARAAHFEGFAFLISLTLVLQGLLMLIFLGRSTERKSRSLPT